MKLIEAYTSCDLPDTLICVNWAGFHTNTEEMGEAGWLIKAQYNHFIKRYLIRFYHPTLFMTFCIKLDSLRDLDGKVFEIEFMSMGGRKKQRPPIIKTSEFSSEDIPALLDVILELQKPVRKKQIQSTQLPKADVVYLQKLSNS